MLKDIKFFYKIKKFYKKYYFYEVRFLLTIF